MALDRKSKFKISEDMANWIIGDYLDGFHEFCVIYIYRHRDDLHEPVNLFDDDIVEFFVASSVPLQGFQAIPVHSQKQCQLLNRIFVITF